MLDGKAVTVIISGGRVVTLMIAEGVKMLVIVVSSVYGDVVVVVEVVQSVTAEVKVVIEGDSEYEGAGVDSGIDVDSLVEAADGGVSVMVITTVVGVSNAVTTMVDNNVDNCV